MIDVCGTREREHLLIHPILRLGKEDVESDKKKKKED